MNPEQQLREEEVLHSAGDISILAEREADLDRPCGDAAEMRRRDDELLPGL